MTLVEKQRLFAKLVPRLIDKAHEFGFEVTLGDAFRDPRVFGKLGAKVGYGNAFSCHKLRLAIDLNLFRDGAYITTETPEYLALGEWWERQHQFSAWGGRWADPNHFSFVHEGVK